MHSIEHVPAQKMREFIERCLARLGLPRRDAGAVAELMTEADLQGADGHGIFRLPQYVRRIQAGAVNVRPNIHLERERSAMALVHGDNGMGHLVMKFAAHTAIAKARTAGSAWVGVKMSNHAGPASLYAKMAMREDMIGLYLAVGNANHLPPWGGLEMLLSTNPIAVAIPGGDEPPIVLDMAPTVAAYGKVKVRAQRGEMMPEGWMVDREGRPLTDPRRMAEGLLLPIGGYKGYGLALVFGLLAGTLNGAAMGRAVVDFNADDSSVTNTGHAIVALDISAFDEVDAFKARVDDIARQMRSAERMKGVERIWLPGEQSQAKHAQRLRDGVPLAPALRRALDELAAELGVESLG
ncbi:MAG: Ldh family oxidoreductase [Betaproteobacteria bacterium]|nr:Ldh family oxidoreductase [Betaproteobacteria bacterium]